jgi:hypothetical protein
VSARDAGIIKSAFHKEVGEKKIPECQWRELAAQLVQSYTGSSAVDPHLLEWIVTK